VLLFDDICIYHVVWDHTCHLTQVSTLHLNPNQTGRYSIYLPRRDGRQPGPVLITTLIEASTLTTTLHHHVVVGGMMLTVKPKTRLKYCTKCDTWTYI